MQVVLRKLWLLQFLVSLLLVLCEAGAVMGFQKMPVRMQCSLGCYTSLVCVLLLSFLSCGLASESWAVRYTTAFSP